MGASVCHSNAAKTGLKIPITNMRRNLGIALLRYQVLSIYRAQRLQIRALVIDSLFQESLDDAKLRFNQN
ncbi:hypothetical protein GCM10010919_08290 [Alishewanella longhuensis]|uniref:Uncharacterized protein n=1 Tax=Alishewanella longhuensis TaxID=1091037 RepID=A0ABQ3KXC3_9ALTE|nr:hypothetical protein GCM10010919_08290 [Alishewanella longhuensis]